MKKDFRVRIFQPVVQEYRVALHEGLAERYGERIELWAAEKRNGDVSYPLHKMRCDYSHSFKRLGPFQWQCGLSLRGLSKGDVVVVCGDIHQLSSVCIAFMAKCRGIHVVWWGHHASALAKERNVRIRLVLARLLSDVMLCYTDEGIEYLVRHGVNRNRVFATGNTLDLEAVGNAISKWNGERVFKSGKILLFCGVLRSKVRVDVLLRALQRICQNHQDLHCVIIGGGDQFEAWRKLACELKVDRYVTWVGELRGQDVLAPWFLSADLFVYPGRVGLSVIHAFSYGLPVILNDNISNHGPEYTVFKPGENGWSFRENDDGDLAEKIEMAMADPEAKKKGAMGRQIVFANYSMTRMVERFAEAIEAAARGDDK